MEEARFMTYRYNVFHLLFTPFFPFLSFLYCSLSLVITPWSTFQASGMRHWSSFSKQSETNETAFLNKILNILSQFTVTSMNDITTIYFLLSITILKSYCLFIRCMSHKMQYLRDSEQFNFLGNNIKFLFLKTQKKRT